jgi:hypothetical protein
MQITKISHVTSNTDTITVMPGVEAGDLLIFADFVGKNLPELVVPSGFTNIRSIFMGSWQRMAISYKIATGTESGTVLTGMDYISGQSVKLLVLFRGSRGSRGIQSVTIKSLVSAASETSGTINQTITTQSGAKRPIIFMAHYASSSTSAGNALYSFSGNTIEWGEDAEETILRSLSNYYAAAVKYSIINITDRIYDSVDIYNNNTNIELGHGLIGFYLQLG